MSDWRGHGEEEKGRGLMPAGSWLVCLQYGMVQRKRRRSEECCVSSNEGNGKRAGESETQTESTEDDDDCSQNNNNNCIICMQVRTGASTAMRSWLGGCGG